MAVRKLALTCTRYSVNSLVILNAKNMMGTTLINSGGALKAKGSNNINPDHTTASKVKTRLMPSAIQGNQPDTKW